METFTTLENLGAGAAAELFADELQRVLANIADPNTDATATRAVTLKVIIKPKADRDHADVAIFASSKTVASRGVATVLYFGRSEGKYVAVESNPKQLMINFDEPARQKPTAIDMKTGEILDEQRSVK